MWWDFLTSSKEGTPRASPQKRTNKNSAVSNMLIMASIFHKLKLIVPLAKSPLRLSDNP